MLNEQLKRRLVGATVLMSVAVIILPMIFSGRPTSDLTRTDERREGSGPVFVFEPLKLPQQTDNTNENPSQKKDKKIVSSVEESRREPKKRDKAPKQSQKSSSESIKGWFVQVSSLKSKASAEGLVQKLEKEGFPAEISPVTNSSGTTFYRIRLKPVESKESAVKLQQRVKKRFRLDGFVRKAS